MNNCCILRLKQPETGYQGGNLMRLSTKGRYAVRAMTDLAVHGDDGPVARADIACRQDLSADYIAQLFAKLQDAGLVKGVKGPGGGYILNKQPSDIRIGDIMRMSSGLRFRAPQDPDFDPALGYPDHIYVYTGGGNSFTYSANLPQQWEPNTVGRYRNCDPVLTNYLIRLGVEGMGEDYLSYPQRALFDKLGIRDMVMETDPYGNYLLQGYEFGTPRDWARLGNLYLQDGVWEGERLLPEGFVEYVSTLAPAWKADNRPIYGGFFWINGDGSFPIPEDAYFYFVLQRK